MKKSQPLADVPVASDVFRAEAPDTGDAPDMGLIRSQVEQRAREDATRGTDDRESIFAQRGHLSGELWVSELVEAYRESYRQGKIKAVDGQRQYVLDKENEHHKVPLVEIEHQYDFRNEELIETKKRRQSAVDVLEGAREDAWGRRLTGDVPAQKRGLAWAGLHPIQNGIVALLLLGETAATLVMMLDLIEPYKSDGTWDWLRGITAIFLGIVGSVALVYLPIQIGGLIRGQSDPKTARTSGEKWRFWILQIVLWAVWVVIVIVATIGRLATAAPTESERRKYMNPVYALQNLNTEAYWFLFAFLAAGIVIVIIHGSENPYQVTIVACDSAITHLEHDLSKLKREINNRKFETQSALEGVETLGRQYDHWVDDLLPRWKALFLQEFRREYRLTVSDPNISDALFLGDPDMSDMLSLPDLGTGEDQ